MLKFEKKLISWLNRHMILIALGFVVFAAAWMRLAGRNFVGIDYHYSLYDLPGNCSSVLYRMMIQFFLKTDYVIVLVKLLAYAGDFGVALLTLLLVYRKNQKLTDLRTFLVVTACLLSPVGLIYSIGGMEIDSVCMCLLLLGLLLYNRAGLLPAVPVMAVSAFVYSAYWPVVIVLSAYLAVKESRVPKENGLSKENQVLKGNQTLRKKSHVRLSGKTAAALVVLGICLLLSIFVENRGMAGGYFWGKIFIVNPDTAEGYANPIQYLLAMGKIYGYFAATGSLLMSFHNKRWRIPALVLQVLVLMYVGWNMTAHLTV